jgi:hypothetical protein
MRIPYNVARIKYETHSSKAADVIRCYTYYEILKPEVS